MEILKENQELEEAVMALKAGHKIRRPRMPNGYLFIRGLGAKTVWQYITEVARTDVWYPTNDDILATDWQILTKE
ncbi:MAG: Thoeris anti-defense Tad2 family protein [Aeromonas veronii]